MEAAKLANNKTPRNPKNAADVQNMVFGKKGRKVPLANTPIMYIYNYTYIYIYIYIEIGCSWGPQRIAKLVELLFSQTNKHNLGAHLVQSMERLKNMGLTLVYL